MIRRSFLTPTLLLKRDRERKGDAKDHGETLAWVLLRRRYQRLGQCHKISEDTRRAWVDPPARSTSFPISKLQMPRSTNCFRRHHGNHRPDVDSSPGRLTASLQVLCIQISPGLPAFQVMAAKSSTRSQEIFVRGLRAVAT